MFTGIVQNIGKVEKVEKLAASARIVVRGVPKGIQHGESVAVNGVCLTAIEDSNDGLFTADVMNETLKRTTIGELKPGDDVNIERATTTNSFLGGHIVQGHVDGVGTLASRTPGDQWEVLRFSAPKTLTKYLVEKGSITVSGVSLTVVDCDEKGFTVSLIPTTLRDTTLGNLPVGGHVNLEADMVGKHIFKYTEPYLKQLKK